MSRRKGKRVAPRWSAPPDGAPTDEGQEQAPSFVEMEIVCTGRRTHSRHRLQKIKVWPELGRVGRRDGDDVDFYIWEPHLHGGAGPNSPHMTRTYKCERCGRSVPLQDETADEILLGLAAAGESCMDISALHVK